MANRSKDWIRQAQRDLTHARNALEDGDFEWSCFACQQAAEKAVKAV
jgi:HEPN domain-containing protein